MDRDDHRTADVAELLTYTSDTSDSSYRLATAILIARDECWVPYHENLGWSAVMDEHSLREMDSKKRAASVARLAPLLASGTLRRVLVECCAVFSDDPRAAVPRLLLELHVPAYRMVLWL